MEMPKFNFAECSIKDDEELQKELEKAGGDSKYFRPGQYEVTIASIEYKGANKKDDTWGQLELVLKGSGEKEIKEFLMIPFKDVKFGEKKSLYPFKKVQAFCKALGVELKASNLQETMQTVFGNAKKLVNAPLSVKIGYPGAYVNYAGKVDDKPTFNIVLRDGNVARNEAGEAIVFADKDSAGVYADANKIAVEKYVKVLQYDVSQSGAPLNQTAASW